MLPSCDWVPRFLVDEVVESNMRKQTFAVDDAFCPHRLYIVEWTTNFFRIEGAAFEECLIQDNNSDQEVSREG